VYNCIRFSRLQPEDLKAIVRSPVYHEKSRNDASTPAAVQDKESASIRRRIHTCPFAARRDRLVRRLVVLHTRSNAVWRAARMSDHGELDMASPAAV
jgi:hypothetical protein